MRTSLVAGFTLVEVLVAVLVLAIGVLGAAGAQVAALRTRQGTGHMSHAVQLASTLADRMRANASQAGTANPYLLLSYDAETDGEPVKPGVSCFSGSACSAAQMAAFDAYEIAHTLYTRFPGARIVVCRDATVWVQRALVWPCDGNASAPVVIKLGWRSRRAHEAASASVPFAPAVALVVAAGGA